MATPGTAVAHDALFAAKWTDNQICPACGLQVESCDFCHACDIELWCAQTDEGLRAATLRIEHDRRVLVLARVTRDDEASA